MGNSKSLPSPPTSFFDSTNDNPLYADEIFTQHTHHLNSGTFNAQIEWLCDYVSKMPPLNLSLRDHYKAQKERYLSHRAVVLSGVEWIVKNYSVGELLKGNLYRIVDESSHENTNQENTHHKNNDKDERKEKKDKHPSKDGKKFPPEPIVIDLKTYQTGFNKLLKSLCDNKNMDIIYLMMDHSHLIPFDTTTFFLDNLISTSIASISPNETAGDRAGVKINMRTFFTRTYGPRLKDNTLIDYFYNPQLINFNPLPHITAHKPPLPNHRLFAMMEYYTFITCMCSSSNFFPKGFTLSATSPTTTSQNVYFFPSSTFISGTTTSTDSPNTPATNLSRAMLKDTKITVNSLFYSPVDIATTFRQSPSLTPLYPSLFNNQIIPTAHIGAINGPPSFFALGQRNATTNVYTNALGESFLVTAVPQPGSFYASVKSPTQWDPVSPLSVTLTRHDQLLYWVGLMYKTQHNAIVGLVNHYRNNFVLWSDTFRKGRNPFSLGESAHHYTYPSVFRRLRKEFEREMMITQKKMIGHQQQDGLNNNGDDQTNDNNNNGEKFEHDHPSTSRPTKALDRNSLESAAVIARYWDDSTILPPNETITYCSQPAAKDFFIAPEILGGTLSAYNYNNINSSNTRTYSDSTVMVSLPVAKVDGMLEKDVVRISEFNTKMGYYPSTIKPNEISDVFAVTPQSIFNNIHQYLATTHNWFSDNMASIINSQQLLNPSKNERNKLNQLFRFLKATEIRLYSLSSTPKSASNDAQWQAYYRSKREYKAFQSVQLSSDRLIDGFRILFFLAYAECPMLYLTKQALPVPKNPFYRPSDNTFTGVLQNLSPSTRDYELYPPTKLPKIQLQACYKDLFELQHVMNRWSSSNHTQTHPFLSSLFSYRPITNEKFSTISSSVFSGVTATHEAVTWDENKAWGILHYAIQPERDQLYHPSRRFEWLLSLREIALYQYNYEKKTDEGKADLIKIIEALLNQVKDNTFNTLASLVNAQAKSTSHLLSSPVINSATTTNTSASQNDLPGLGDTKLIHLKPIRLTNHANNPAEFSIINEPTGRIDPKLNAEENHFIRSEMEIFEKQKMFDIQKSIFDTTNYHLAYDWKKLSDFDLSLVPFSGQYALFSNLSTIITALTNPMTTSLYSNNIMYKAYTQEQFELLLGYLIQIFGSSLPPIEYMAKMNYDGPYAPGTDGPLTMINVDNNNNNHESKKNKNNNNGTDDKKESHNITTTTTTTLSSFDKFSTFKQGLNDPTIVTQLPSHLDWYEINHVISTRIATTTIPNVKPFKPNSLEFTQKINYPLRDLFSPTTHEISYHMYPPKNYNLIDYWFFNTTTQRNSLSTLVAILSPLNQIELQPGGLDGFSFTSTPALGNTTLAHSYLTMLEHFGLLPGYVNITPQIESNRIRSLNATPTYFYIPSTENNTTPGSSSKSTWNAEIASKASPKLRIQPFLSTLYPLKYHSKRMSLESRNRYTSSVSEWSATGDGLSGINPSELLGEYFSSELLTYSSLRYLPILNPYRNEYDLSTLSGLLNPLPKGLGPFEEYFRGKDDLFDGFSTLFPIYQTFAQDSEALLLYRNAILIATTMKAQYDRDVMAKLKMLQSKVLGYAPGKTEALVLSRQSNDPEAAIAVINPNHDHYVETDLLISHAAEELERRGNIIQPVDKKDKVDTNNHHKTNHWASQLTPPTSIHFNHSQTIVNISPFGMMERLCDVHFKPDFTFKSDNHDYYGPDNLPDHLTIQTSALNDILCFDPTAMCPNHLNCVDSYDDGTPLKSRLYEHPHNVVDARQIYALELTSIAMATRLPRPTPLAMLPKYLSDPTKQAANPLTVFNLSSLLSHHHQFWLKLLTSGYFWGMGYHVMDGSLQHMPNVGYYGIQFYFKLYQMINTIAHATHKYPIVLTPQSNKGPEVLMDVLHSDGLAFEKGGKPPTSKWFDLSANPDYYKVDAQVGEQDVSVRSHRRTAHQYFPMNKAIQKEYEHDDYRKSYIDMLPTLEDVLLNKVNPVSPQFTDSKITIDSLHPLDYLHRDFATMAKHKNSTTNKDHNNNKTNPKNSKKHSNDISITTGIFKLNKIFAPVPTITIPVSQCDASLLSSPTPHLAFSIYRTPMSNVVKTYRLERNLERKFWSKRVSSIIDVIMPLEEQGREKYPHRFTATPQDLDLQKTLSHYSKRVVADKGFGDKYEDYKNQDNDDNKEKDDDDDDKSKKNQLINKAKVTFSPDVYNKLIKDYKITKTTRKLFNQLWAKWNSLLKQFQDTAKIGTIDAKMVTQAQPDDLISSMVTTPQTDISLHYHFLPPQTQSQAILNTISVYGSFLPPLMTPFAPNLATSLFRIALNALERCVVIKSHIDAMITHNVTPITRANSLPVHAPLTMLEYFAMWLSFSPVVYNNITFDHFVTTPHYDTVTLFYDFDQWSLFGEDHVVEFMNPIFLQLALFTWLYCPHRIIVYMKELYTLPLDLLLTRLYYDGSNAVTFHDYLTNEATLEKYKKLSSKYIYHNKLDDIMLVESRGKKLGESNKNENENKNENNKENNNNQNHGENDNGDDNEIDDHDDDDDHDASPLHHLLNLLSHRSITLFNMFEYKYMMDLPHGLRLVTSNGDDKNELNNISSAFLSKAALYNSWSKPNSHCAVQSPYRPGSFNQQNVVDMYKELFSNNQSDSINSGDNNGNEYYDEYGNYYDDINTIQKKKPQLSFYTISQTMSYIDANITTTEYSVLDNMQYNELMEESMGRFHFHSVDQTLSLPLHYSLPTTTPSASDRVIPKSTLPFYMNHADRATENPTLTALGGLSDKSKDVLNNLLKNIIAKAPGGDDSVKSNDPLGDLVKKITPQGQGDDDNNDSNELINSPSSLSSSSTSSSSSDEPAIKPAFYTGLLYFCIDSFANPSIDDIITIITGFTLDLSSSSSTSSSSLQPTRLLSDPSTFLSHNVRREGSVHNNIMMSNNTNNNYNDAITNNNNNNNNNDNNSIELLLPTVMTTIPWEAPAYPLDLYNSYIVTSASGNTNNNNTNNNNNDGETIPQNQPQPMQITMLIATFIRAITRRVSDPILITLLNAIRSQGELSTLFDYTLFIEKKQTKNSTSILGSVAPYAITQLYFNYKPRWFSASLTLWQLVSAAGYCLPDNYYDIIDKKDNNINNNNQENTANMSFALTLSTLYNELYDQQ